LFPSSIIWKQTTEKDFEERNLDVLQNSSSKEEFILANKLNSLVSIWNCKVWSASKTLNLGCVWNYTGIEMKKNKNKNKFKKWQTEKLKNEILSG
jgi:hypothetical protein